MKRLFSLFLCILMFFSFIIGCTQNKETTTDNPVTLKEGKSFEDVLEGVKQEYSEDYLANMAMDESRFVESTGIDINTVEKFYAGESMISAHVDRFIAIKAKKEKGTEVEEKLIAYRDSLINDTMQYPANVAKLESSEVKRYGDYVYFIMLGKYDDRLDTTKEEKLEYAKKETQRGVDKIESFFNI